MEKFKIVEHVNKFKTSELLIKAEISQRLDYEFYAIVNGLAQEINSIMKERQKLGGITPPIEWSIVDEEIHFYRIRNVMDIKSVRFVEVDFKKMKIYKTEEKRIPIFSVIKAVRF